MTGKRKRYSAEFKARVALEALRGELTVSQLATKHGVRQALIGDWKRQAGRLGDGVLRQGGSKGGHAGGRNRGRPCCRSGQ